MPHHPIFQIKMLKLKLNLTAHPLANLFPMMSDEEYAELKRDIAAHGQIERVTLHEGAILDGRNRYRACVELGITPNTETFHANGLSALDFVIAKNLKRRHLTGGQKAMLALEIEPYFAEQAKERQRESIEERRDDKGRAKPNTEKIQYLDNSEKRNDNTASAQAARAVGTNAHYVSDAKKVAAHAPELVERVKSGEMTLQDASKTARKNQKQNELAMKAESFTLEAPAPQADVSSVAIYHRDARELSRVVSPDVDLVFTSPPYNVGIEYNTYPDDLPPAKYLKLLTQVFAECFRVTRDGARIGVVVPFGVDRDPWRPLAANVAEVLRAVGFTLFGQVTWDKGEACAVKRTSWGSYNSASAPRFRDRTEAIVWAYKNKASLDIPNGASLLDADLFRKLTQDVWSVAPAQHKYHPAVFPEKLAEYAIRLFGYRGCHVLDPFAGVGTTGVVAHVLQCRASLVEMDAAYCKLARERLEQTK